MPKDVYSSESSKHDAHNLDFTSLDHSFRREGFEVPATPQQNLFEYLVDSKQLVLHPEPRETRGAESGQKVLIFKKCSAYNSWPRIEGGWGIDLLDTRKLMNGREYRLIYRGAVESVTFKKPEDKYHKTGMSQRIVFSIFTDNDIRFFAVYNSVNEK